MKYILPVMLVTSAVWAATNSARIERAAPPAEGRSATARDNPPWLRGLPDESEVTDQEDPHAGLYGSDDDPHAGASDDEQPRMCPRDTLAEDGMGDFAQDDPGMDAEDGDPHLH